MKKRNPTEGRWWSTMAEIIMPSSNRGSCGYQIRTHPLLSWDIFNHTLILVALCLGWSFWWVITSAARFGSGLIWRQEMVGARLYDRSKANLSSLNAIILLPTHYVLHCFPSVFLYLVLLHFYIQSDFRGCGTGPAHLRNSSYLQIYTSRGCGTLEMATCHSWSSCK